MHLHMIVIKIHQYVTLYIVSYQLGYMGDTILFFSIWEGLLVIDCATKW